MADLQDKRPCELEMLATGIGQPTLAAWTVRFMLLCVRSLVHMAAILTDTGRMDAIRHSKGHCGAVAALSMGTSSWNGVDHLPYSSPARPWRPASMRQPPDRRLRGAFLARERRDPFQLLVYDYIRLVPTSFARDAGRALANGWNTFSATRFIRAAWSGPVCRTNFR